MAFSRRFTKSRNFVEGTKFFFSKIKPITSGFLLITRTYLVSFLVTIKKWFLIPLSSEEAFSISYLSAYGVPGCFPSKPQVSNSLRHETFFALPELGSAWPPHDATCLRAGSLTPWLAWTDSAIATNFKKQHMNGNWNF